MHIKRFLLLATVFVIVVSVSGCKLPASTAPAATPTTGTGFPVPGTETYGLFETIATQTAAAASGQPAVQAETQVANPSATNKPGVKPLEATAKPTKTPAPPKPTKKPVTVKAATEGIPDSYTLEKGEFPYCIARRFNVNPGELLSKNGLTGSSMTYAGMKLILPQTGHNFPDGRELHSHPADYTVRSGDSIFSIACYYGDVDPLVIADVNGLNEPYSLSAGQVLQIP
jgi:LysM repeat protein